MINTIQRVIKNTLSIVLFINLFTECSIVKRIIAKDKKIKLNMSMLNKLRISPTIQNINALQYIKGVQFLIFGEFTRLYFLMPLRRLVDLGFLNCLTVVINTRMAVIRVIISLIKPMNSLENICLATFKNNAVTKYNNFKLLNQ